MFGPSVLQKSVAPGPKMQKPAERNRVRALENLVVVGGFEPPTSAL
jgi:hypothetical protein